MTAEHSPNTPPQADAILAALGQAAFVWDISTDAIVWTDQVTAIFQNIPTATLATGAGLASLLEP